MKDRHDSRVDPDLEGFLQTQRADYEERNYWFQQSLGAENQWLFIQASDALKHELYLPACTGFLTGIEASLRNTIAQLQNLASVENLVNVSTLSNGLLRIARDSGISIDCLIFPGEQAFEENLLTRQNHVSLVKVRHKLCHGNIFEYVVTPEGLPAFFTPECCRELAHTLHQISREWVASLGAFRDQTIGL